MKVTLSRAWSGLLLAAAVLAASTVRAGGPAEVVHHLGDVLQKGHTALYFSGYAHHNRRTYGPELLPFLNETSWGGGIGRTLELKDGGAASIAVTAFRDSLDEWEYTLGYSREWRWAPFDGELKLGAGLTGFLTSRQDFFDGTPFPAVLPLASVTYDSTAVLATYIPRIPGVGRGFSGVPDMNGDVVYVFARVGLK